MCVMPNSPHVRRFFPGFNEATDFAGDIMHIEVSVVLACVRLCCREEGEQCRMRCFWMPGRAGMMQYDGWIHAHFKKGETKKKEKDNNSIRNSRDR